MRSALRSATAPSAGRSRAAIAVRAAARSPSTPRQPGRVIRRRARRCAPSPRWNPSAFGPAAVTATTSRTSQPSPPASGRADRVAAVGALATRHLDEAAEDRTRRRAGAEPRQRRQLIGRQRQSRRARRRHGQRGEAGRGRRQPGRRRHAVVGGDDTPARDRAGARPHAIEKRRHARDRRGIGGRAVHHDAIVAPARRCQRCRRRRTVVRVPSRPSVSDRLPVAGRFSAASRLPQYFTSAMFVPANAVTARTSGHVRLRRCRDAGQKSVVTGGLRQRASTSRSCPGASAITAPPPPRAGQLGADRPRGARPVDHDARARGWTAAAPPAARARHRRCRPRPSTSPERQRRRSPSAPGPEQRQHAVGRRQPLAQPRHRRDLRDRVARPARQADAQRDRLAHGHRLPAVGAREPAGGAARARRPRRCPTGCRGTPSPPR